MNIINSLISNKRDLWILYYTALYIIIMQWTNTSEFPPMVLRLGMMVAVFGPLFKNPEFTAFVFSSTIMLRMNLMTAYSYLPDAYSYGVYYLILIILLVSNRRKVVYNKDFISFLCIFLLWALTDLIANGEIGKYAIGIGYVLLLYPFVNGRKSVETIAIGFIIVSALLSQHFIVHSIEFAISYGSSGLERGFWVDPNYFSSQILIGFTMALLILMGHLKISGLFSCKTVIVPLCIMCALGIVSMASRSSFIGMAFLTLFAVASSKSSLVTKILGGIVIAAIGYYFVVKGSADLLMYRLFNEYTIKNGGGRTDIWRSFIDVWGLENPFLMIFGHGYQDVCKLVNSHLHNDFLGILNSYGVLGVSLYFGNIFRMFKIEAPVEVKHTAMICILLILYAGIPLCISYCYTFSMLWILVIGIRIHYSNTAYCY